ncbi:lipid IV(A) palmitoyltransferase PagP [Vogesella oryzae]|uniref:lipid IV(A) palmitoyltransferase PagP n=1 Tax=Vogesella oryzae TaxID=1735285 RepID=UPI001FE4DB2C|nr:lipid IV(A) palmitoyltransferase PagP [Vogesella oryzae]
MKAVTRAVAVAVVAMTISVPAFASEAAGQSGKQDDLAANLLESSRRAGDKTLENMAETWGSSDYELYIPLHTWHNRAMYSAEKIRSYNENPWGLGVGKYRYDADGNWQAWYAMAFLDSHHDVEPIVGYGYQKIWRPGGDWRLGAGVTAGLTMRSDYNYVPLPVVLPTVSVEYGRFSLQSTYIPGAAGAGNVLFTWARWQLSDKPGR